jgi:hypothetical protein
MNQSNNATKMGIYQTLGFLAVGAVWWSIFSISGFLERKMSVTTFIILRWIIFLPLAVLAYISAAFIWDLGQFFFLIGYPAFVAAGMYAAPAERRWIPGVALLAVIVIVAISEIRAGWNADQTRIWLSSAGGTLISCAVVYKMRDFEDD